MAFSCMLLCKWWCPGFVETERGTFGSEFTLCTSMPEIQGQYIGLLVRIHARLVLNTLHVASDLIAPMTLPAWFPSAI